MITQYFVNVFSTFLGQIYALFPAQPSWMTAFGFDVPTAGVVPATVLNLTFGAWLTIWLVTAGIRFVRLVTSYFTLGGG